MPDVMNRRTAHGAWWQPRELGAALAALQARHLTVLAGGTDLMATGEAGHLVGDVLDISGIDALRGVRRDGCGWRIGALTSWRALQAAALPAWFDALKAAAREVGGLQIQNRGTLGGNLCNASPAADGVAPLLALDASVELTSARGIRTLRLDAFILGNRRTARRPDELVTAIRVPAHDEAMRSAFRKLGARRYLVISIAMVAVTLRSRAGTVDRATVAVGACGPVARRLPELEARLAGMPLTALSSLTIDARELAPLTPRDDVRGSAGYRLRAVRTLVRDALGDAAGALARVPGSA